MSLNFPTAFWKNPSEPEEDTGTPSINWTTALVWSKGNNGATEASEFNFPLSHTTNFPFTITDGNLVQEDFYTTYDDATWQNDTSSASSTPYFGWHLTGGYGVVEVGQEYDLQNYHLANPWIVGGALGSDLKIYFESDFSTAGLIGTPDPNPTTDGFDNLTYRIDIYNNFIQSGNATGSFTLSTTSNLTIKVSGLGEDYENAAGALNYDTMVLYLDNGSTKEFICSGAAPEDGRNVRSLGDDNYDMQQVKLYAGNNLNTIVNTTVSPNGEPRGNAGQLVNQNTRDLGYTTTNGIGTFTKSNLAAGDYKIIIEVSTIDGIFSSGAFYGFNFTFS